MPLYLGICSFFQPDILSESHPLMCLGGILVLGKVIFICAPPHRCHLFVHLPGDELMFSLKNNSSPFPFLVVFSKGRHFFQNLILLLGSLSSSQMCLLFWGTTTSSRTWPSGEPWAGHFHLWATSPNSLLCWLAEALISQNRCSMTECTLPDVSHLESHLSETEVSGRDSHLVKRQKFWL